MKNVAATSNQSEEQTEQNKWWKFKITDEQARAWQYGDVNAAKQFYEENERLLRGIAKHYMKRSVIDNLKHLYYRAALIELQRKYEYGEMLSQIYADMISYHFWDSHSLYRCIIRSCVGLVYGGYEPFCKVLTDIAIHSSSLDAPIGEDDGDELIDIIADSKTIDDYVEQPTTAMSIAFEKTLEQIAQMLYPRPQDELQRLAFIRRF